MSGSEFEFFTSPELQAMYEIWLADLPSLRLAPKDSEQDKGLKDG